MQECLVMAVPSLWQQATMVRVSSRSAANRYPLATSVGEGEKVKSGMQKTFLRRKIERVNLGKRLVCAGKTRGIEDTWVWDLA